MIITLVIIVIKILTIHKLYVNNNNTKKLYKMIIVLYHKIFLIKVHIQLILNRKYLITQQLININNTNI